MMDETSRALPPVRFFVGRSWLVAHSWQREVEDLERTGYKDGKDGEDKSNPTYICGRDVKGCPKSPLCHAERSDPAPAVGAGEHLD